MALPTLAHLQMPKALLKRRPNARTDQLGWEPQQVQAAIWVAEKGRRESGVEKAAFDYSNALLKNNRGQISWEAQPGWQIICQRLFDAPYEVQQEYHVAIIKAFLDDDGNDISPKRTWAANAWRFRSAGILQRPKVQPRLSKLRSLPRQFGSKGAGQVEQIAPLSLWKLTAQRAGYL